MFLRVNSGHFLKQRYSNEGGSEFVAEGSDAMPIVS
jgi:hypothetical protein